MIQIAEAVKQFLIGTVVPFVTSSLVTWAASAHLLAVLSLSPTSAAKAVTSGLVFIASYAFTWLTQHKILAGHYTPAAKRAMAGDRLERATRL